MVIPVDAGMQSVFVVYVNVHVPLLKLRDVTTSMQVKLPDNEADSDADADDADPDADDADADDADADTDDAD